MYESSWLWIAPAASENNGLIKTAVNRTAKPRKAATRVCSACLAFRQESDGLALSFPGRVSSVSSAGGLSMSHRVITRAAPLNFFAGKFRRDRGDRLLVISSRGGASLLHGLHFAILAHLHRLAALASGFFLRRSACSTFSASVAR